MEGEEGDIYFPTETILRGLDGNVDRLTRTRFRDASNNLLRISKNFNKVTSQNEGQANRQSGGFGRATNLGSAENEHIALEGDSDHLRLGGARDSKNKLVGGLL